MMSTDRSALATWIRASLLDALNHGILTTAELRHLLTASKPGVVAEQVYASLLVLEHRGEVQRARPSGRHVSWERVRRAARRGA